MYSIVRTERPLSPPILSRTVHNTKYVISQEEGLSFFLVPRLFFLASQLRGLFSSLSLLPRDKEYRGWG